MPPNAVRLCMAILNGLAVMLMAHAREVGGRGRCSVKSGRLGSVTEPSALRGKTLSLYFIVAIKPYIHYTLVKPYRVCFLPAFWMHIFTYHTSSAPAERSSVCVSRPVRGLCVLASATCESLAVSHSESRPWPWLLRRAARDWTRCQ